MVDYLVLQVVATNAPKLPDITVFRIASLSVEEQVEVNNHAVVPYFNFNVGVMISFCIVACMITDWVKSKPFIGILGLISTMMSIFAAFGFCMYIGVPFITFNLAAPFLMLGMYFAFCRCCFMLQVPSLFLEEY